MIAALLTVLVTAFGTALTMYVSVIRPREKERKKEAEKQRARDAVIDGVDPVPGMTNGQAAIAVRMETVEQAIVKSTASVDALTAKQTEQNGDIKEVKADVRTINSTIADMKGMIGDLFNSVNELLNRPAPLTQEQIDKVAAARISETQEQTHTIIDAIHSTQSD